MPRPSDVSVSDDVHCAACPLQCKQRCPLTPRLENGAECIVITEHPGPQDHLVGDLLQGPPGRFLAAALKARGIGRYSVIPRIACFPATKQKRLAKTLRQAAICCTQRFQKALSKADPHGELKRLFVGKHSAYGVHLAYQATLRSGAILKVPFKAVAKDLPVDGDMFIDHPRVPSWYKTASKPTWYAALDRFGDCVRGIKHPSPPTPHIAPDETALQLLRHMGSVIGWDVETLGIDPLTATITCIGLSDGQNTVVLPWEPYSTAVQGDVPGLLQYGELGKKLHAEVLKILASDRIQVTQNGSYDTLAMGARGLPGRNDFDTLHAHKILWPEIPAGLEAIGVHLIKRLDKRWKSIFRAGKDDDAKGSDAYSDSREEDLRDYCGLDAWVTRAAYDQLNKQLAIED